MTYTTTARATTQTRSGLLARLWESLAETFRRSAAYQQTRAELDAMSDRDLADIGITRSMIDDLARGAAARL